MHQRLIPSNSRVQPSQCRSVRRDEILFFDHAAMVNFFAQINQT